MNLSKIFPKLSKLTTARIDAALHSAWITAVALGGGIATAAVAQGATSLSGIAAFAKSHWIAWAVTNAITPAIRAATVDPAVVEAQNPIPMKRFIVTTPQEKAATDSTIPTHTVTENSYVRETPFPPPNIKDRTVASIASAKEYTQKSPPVQSMSWPIKESTDIEKIPLPGGSIAVVSPNAIKSDPPKIPMRIPPSSIASAFPIQLQHTLPSAPPIVLGEFGFPKEKSKPMTTSVTTTTTTAAPNFFTEFSIAEQVALAILGDLESFSAGIAVSIPPVTLSTAPSGAKSVLSVTVTKATVATPFPVANFMALLGTVFIDLQSFFAGNSVTIPPFTEELGKTIVLINASVYVIPAPVPASVLASTSVETEPVTTSTTTVTQ
jgi:hypothetical protein